MILSGQVYAQASGITLLARILGLAGNPITQATLTSIAYTVTNLTLGQNVGSGTFTISTTVFDALQTNDPRWRFDDPYNPGPDGLWGFNFAAVLPATLFPITTITTSPDLGVPGPTLPGQPPTPQRMQCDVAFTPVTGQPFRQIFLWSVLDVYG